MCVATLASRWPTLCTKSISEDAMHDWMTSELSLDNTSHCMLEDVYPSEQDVDLCGSVTNVCIKPLKVDTPLMDSHNVQARITHDIRTYILLTSKY